MHAASKPRPASTNETKCNQTKYFDLRQANSVVYRGKMIMSARSREKIEDSAGIAAALAQSAGPGPENQLENRPYLVASLRSATERNKSGSCIPDCHYKAIFGEGDADDRTLQSVGRFAEVTLDAQGNCHATLYDHEEEIYFILQGKTDLHYGDRTYAMRPNDFTYLPPGLKHSIANTSDQPAQVLVMSFKVPARISIKAPPPQPKIVNLDDVKEETVEGHPTSVLYKLLLGPRNGKRDAIDDAYVVTSFFWMNFAPGGTNFPHHHETAEEIYLVLDGEGVMVAGGGMDGIAGRYPPKLETHIIFALTARWGSTTRTNRERRRTSWRCDRRFPCLKGKIRLLFSSFMSRTIARGHLRVFANGY